MMSTVPGHPSMRRYDVTVQIANEQADLGMDAAELHRLTLALQRHTPIGHQ
jgi:hypothetical protein